MFVGCFNILQQPPAYFLHYIIVRVTSLKSSKKILREIKYYKYIKQNTNQNTHTQQGVFITDTSPPKNIHCKKVILFVHLSLLFLWQLGEKRTKGKAIEMDGINT